MKKLIALSLAFASAILMLDAVAQAVPPPPPASNGRHVIPGSRRPDFMKKRAERIAAAGGLIQAPVTSKVVRVANSQKIASREIVDKAVGSFRKFMKYPVEVREGAIKDVIDDKAGIVIAIADDANWPALLIAPEEGWATVNVRKLATDNPSPEVLETRLTKEFWRAAAMVLGAANSVMQPCVLCPIRNLADLDACKATVPAPEPLPKLDRGAKSFGIWLARQVTYKRACEEGWAPAPTNDIQKAVWEKVHSIPDQPIKIKFDPAADKPKTDK